jgi:hypothetical protein
VIKNLEAEVRHSHLIDIRKSEAEFQFDLGRVLSNRIDLLAQVPDRF